MTSRQMLAVVTMIVIGIIIGAGLSACVSTPTATPQPTATPTLCVGCGTPALPPTVTVTATPAATSTPTASATPQPTATCPACPVCATPIPPALLYLRCYIDDNDSGDYTGGEPLLPCVLRFGQDVGLEGLVYQTITLTNGIGGVSLLPGSHTVEVVWHDGGIPITPSAVYCPMFVIVNPGANDRWDCAFNEYGNPATRTHTPTTTPIIVPSATPNAATKTRMAGG